MPYTPNPVDPTAPTDTEKASTAALEFRTLKAYIQDTILAAINAKYPLAGNPSGFLTGITSGQVIAALGYTPYNSTNPSGYLNGINATMVNNAYGFTLGTNAKGNKTVSAAGPSGGVDGDVWYQI